jgi:RNA polymerase sigma-70 factor (sigma-E family)
MSESADAPMDATRDFTSFCRSEYSGLVGALSLLVGDHGLAQDLAQEALARAWSKWSRVGRLDRPDLWAKHVAVNLGRSLWRRKQVADRAAATFAPSMTFAAGVSATAGDALLEAVSRLPGRQRAAIALRYFADMTVADAARVMGCREGTVKALTSQAISGLRRALVNNQGGQDD